MVSFAGHGSPDGSLVLFDTNPSDLSGTALSMAALADSFKQSKARFVLCILDCCFSGQAPARVLEISARPKNSFALAGICGEGRDSVDRMCDDRSGMGTLSVRQEFGRFQ